MSRLIDAEKLEEVILNLPLDELADGFTFKSYRFVMDSIHKQPTIDPIKHAKWIILEDCSNEGVYCTYCHKKCFDKKYYANVRQQSKYCPNCGAKMDGE